MAIVAHISDLHFGRDEPEMTAGLLTALRKLGPDVIVISGDFTQRAKKKQFRAARAFMREMPAVPRLVVPGNHDVSATNLLERALRPLRRYRRYICADLAPFCEVPGVAIAGINTVRVVARKDGRINSLQVAKACEQLGGADADAARIVVTHHPMDLPASDAKNAVVVRAAAAMKTFAGCGVDLFLSGHLHTGLALTSTARYGGRGMVVAHAGTAISTRTRKEPNGWNVIRLGPAEMEVERMVWGEGKFVAEGRSGFVRGAKGWVSAS